MGGSFFCKENKIQYKKRKKVFMKTLIIYYSYEGETRSIVEAVQKKYGYEAEQILVEEEKQHKGIVKYVWGGRQVMQKKEPNILKMKNDLEKFDRILLGTPVWASSFTPAIRTFLKENNLKNKKVGLFCTHKGMKGSTFEDFENNLEESSIVGKLELINVKKNKKESIQKIFNWIEDLNKNE